MTRRVATFISLGLALAFFCPLLFIPMNVTVLPTIKLVCEVGFLLFLTFAGFMYLGNRR